MVTPINQPWRLPLADRVSPVQGNYPKPEDFVILAKRLWPDAIRVMLEYVWHGYDRLREGDRFDVAKDDAHLEDEITMALYARIQDVIDPYFPFAVVHQWPEIEQQKGMGRSPQCDFAFRLRGGNVRSHFSVEAKVIRTDRAVSEYIGEINDNFLTGRYSTFSSEAAMLGYRLSGTAATTFDAIGKALQSVLTEYSPLPDREHRCSCHSRDLGNKSGIAAQFRCHHLLMHFG